MRYFTTVLVMSLITKMALMPDRLLAQARSNGGDAYAAPGMMVKIGRSTAFNTPKSTPAPAISSIILPRFWNQTDSTRKAEYANFIRELYRQIKYPVSSLREQVEGIIYLNFRVTADGQIDGITLKKSNLVWSGEATSAAKDALAAEAMRVAKTLRFAPSTSSTDTVTVPVNYRIQ